MDYSRQKEVFDPTQFKLPVHVVGCGATGSWVAMLLAKLGVADIHLWDFDIVEEHNIPNQLFMLNDVGCPKASSTSRNCEAATGTLPFCTMEAVTGDTPLTGVVFILTDTMKSRSDIYKKALKNNPHIPLVIETRMGTESGRVYAFNPCDKKQTNAYAATLYTDEDSVESACGISQSLAPTAAMTASIAVWQFLKWAADEAVTNEVIYDVKNDTYLSRNFV